MPTRFAGIRDCQISNQNSKIETARSQWSLKFEKTNRTPHHSAVVYPEKNRCKATVPLRKLAATSLAGTCGTHQGKFAARAERASQLVAATENAHETSPFPGS